MVICGVKKGQFRVAIREVKKGSFFAVIYVVKNMQFWVVISVAKKGQFWVVVTMVKGRVSRFSACASDDLSVVKIIVFRPIRSAFTTLAGYGGKLL